MASPCISRSERSRSSTTCGASPWKARSAPRPSSGCSNGSSTKPDDSSAASCTATIVQKKSFGGNSSMVVVMEERATEQQIEQVVARLVEMGMDVHRSTGVTRTVLGAVGQGRPDAGLIEMLEGVHEVLRISEPYKLASRTFKPDPTVVTVGDVRIGGGEVVVMAGPCSAETEAQVHTTAAAVRSAGAKILRGGAFKPRSSPYSFQGLGEAGLRML